MPLLSLHARRIDLIAYLFGLALGGTILLASGYADRSTGAVHMSDFAMFWAGARAWMLGIDPYNPDGWRETAIALGAWRPDPSPVFPYFGWSLFLLYPFAFVDLDFASAVWVFGGVAAAMVALWFLLRSFVSGLPVAHTLVGLALLGSHPSRLNVLLGQWGFVMLAALVATVLWLRARHTERAALPAVLFIMKPQLFMLTAPALGVWAWLERQRRFAVGAAGLAAVLVFASVVLLPGWPRAWLDAIPSTLFSGQPRTTTLATVLYGVVGPSGTWLAAGVILGASVLALQFAPRSDAYLAVWLSLSAVAAPYTWSYDHLLLLVPLVIGIGAALSVSRPRAVLVASAGAVVFLVATPLLAVVAAVRNLESFSAFVPLAIFSLLLWAAWPLRRSRRTAKAEMYVPPIPELR